MLGAGARGGDGVRGRVVVAHVHGMGGAWLRASSPATLLESQRLLAIDGALRDAHFPANATGRGRVRMAFEELLLLQIGVAWPAGKGVAERGYVHQALHVGVRKLQGQHSNALD